MNIDISDKSKENYGKSEFPEDYIYHGEDTGAEDLKIFIRSETLKEIDDYLSSDLNNELGGVMTGHVCINSENEMFIKITGSIIAKHTNSSISRLTFTHETWEYINNKLEEEQPGNIILGWFHSHPGHTVFLSSYDLFIQENFFNMEYMAAYVYDPTIKDRGFFYRKNDKTVKAAGYYVYDNPAGTEKKIPAADRSKPETYQKEIEISDSDLKNLKGNPYKNKIIIAGLALNIILLTFLAYSFFDLQKRIVKRDTHQNEIEDLKNQNVKLKERLDNFIVEYELKSAGLSTGVNSEKNAAESGIDSFEVSKNTGKDIQSSASGKKTVKYTVKPGDSIEKITKLFYKSKEKAELIVMYNKLKSKTDIKSGQVLEIPEPEN